MKPFYVHLVAMVDRSITFYIVIYAGDEVMAVRAAESLYPDHRVLWAQDDLPE